ncbi:TonB-dependent receptor [Chitinophaga pinensis]|uniref:TonB-dependent receptor plug n=1 Tax=Chitinophaga pinensis (strain ATCC 43595 / DSM 2588 / LMG 13176 / NBRC 15968 / NCIMB 11800 / UQM 2034) TaxID=485918 RepID=A0A979GYB6_CHIPD|nr:TonB-dependent receptor [Chitinophaga pinensis]ACU61835.1 TonB-dependent receptor plug [Chitinophaga pinensis DSM 2588]
MQKKFAVLALFFSTISSLQALAQHKYTISGIIRDKTTGETLIGASIRILPQSRYNSSSNNFGFYAIVVPEGSYRLVVSYTGYKPDTIALTLSNDLTRNISLLPVSGQLSEVVITSESTHNTLAKAQMGLQKLSTAEMANVPVFLGEKDIIKTIQLLPGIKSAGEGSGGFYVRGGNIDENLLLLDDAPVYNATHLMGFFSTFNSDAIKDLTLYKGAMPAEYGGRLSSVVDVRTKDGNNQQFHGSGGLGIIASRLNLEGPVVKDKGSFIVSGRRTYADVFLRLSDNKDVKKSNLYFYDLNAKANYNLNDHNRIFISYYNGKDNLKLSDQLALYYGNTTGTFRWNHNFNSHLFSNTTLLYSDYNNNIEVADNSSNMKIISKIRDFSLKEDLQYFMSGNDKLNFGFTTTHHNLSPGILDASESSNYNAAALDKKYALESAAYINHEKSMGQWSVNYGLRLSVFNVFGPGNFYTYDAGGNITDSTKYASGELVKTYINLEPRAAASYQLDSVSSVKFAYARNTQNVHLISNSATTSPTDLWILSSPNVKPEIADQLSFGYYRHLRNGRYELSGEVYYKQLQNQIDFKDGAALTINNNVESQLLYGKGRAYGLELFAKKKSGRLSGWVSYTLSRTERQVNAINSGYWYPAHQDQTHNLAIVSSYQLSRKVALSGNWVYNTGNAVTFPSGKYEINGQTVFLYAERNGYRMPAYHRLDVGVTIDGKKGKGWNSSWNFSVYNAYGKENPYIIEFKNDPGNPARTIARQTALFRWVPSITYNFSF